MREYNYDVIILGGGPAGFSAGLYCARGALKTAIIDVSMLGGQPSNYLELENYLGFKKIGGYDLTEKFEQHLDMFGADKFPMQEILSVDLVSTPKVIKTKEYNLMKNMIDTISEENRKIAGWNEGFDPFYGAPVILIVLADKNVPTYIYDGSLVMGNLMNAAESLGVGSIWIHRAKEEFETEEGKNLLRAIGIEGKDLEGIGHLALGYPDGEKPEPGARKKDYIYYAD